MIVTLRESFVVVLVYTVCSPSQVEYSSEPFLYLTSQLSTLSILSQLTTAVVGLVHETEPLMSSS